LKIHYRIRHDSTATAQTSADFQNGRRSDEQAAEIC
jgi:hypothetical protein